MRRRVAQFSWILAGLLPSLTACNLLTPLAFVGEHKKAVTAEFDKLRHKRVAIVVWIDAATLFDFPYARFELAAYTGDKLFAEMAQRHLNTEVVDPRDVEDCLQKNIDAQVDAQAVGRHFNADYVVYIEVYKFQIRDPQQPQFLRGRISASTSVYDVRSDPDQLRHYELTPVNCVYPDSAPVFMSGTNSALVREATYRKFAELVARKFYEYTVDL